MEQSQSSKATLLYELLIQFYPKDYRKNYAQEMKLIFADMYQDEIKDHPEIRLVFWINLIWDIFISTFKQHYQLLKHIGIWGYLKAVMGITNIRFISLLLILPFIIISLINLISVILVGRQHALDNLFQNHYWIYIISSVLGLTLISFFINLTTLVVDWNQKKTNPFSIRFIGNHFFEIILSLFGIGVIILMFGHDAIPCTIDHIFTQGLLNIDPIINYCKNA